MKSSYFPLAAIPLALLPGFLQAQHAGPVGRRDVRTPVEVTNHSAQLIGPYDQSQKLRLVFGLNRPKAAEEQQFLKALYTHGSPEYHKYLTAQQWNDRFAPSAADEQTVVDWATSQGFTVTQRFPNRLLVDVEAPVAQIQKALGVNINRYQFNDSIRYSNDRDPVIPASLSGIVLSVLGLNNMQVMRPHSNLPRPLNVPDYSEGPAEALVAEDRANGDRTKLAAAKAAKKNNAARPGITDGFYDPLDIYDSSAYDYNALYNLGHCCNPNQVAGGTPPETSIAIWTIGAHQISDIQGFHNQFPYLAYNTTLFNVDGTPTCCDGEGTMDAEWATAMANSFGSSDDTAHVYIYQAANDSAATAANTYEHMLTDGLARVMTVSFGCPEFSDCETDSIMDTQDGIFSAMTAQGWTLVADADDKGSVADCATVSVEFPASSPNVIAAGGTELTVTSGFNFFAEFAWEGGADPGSCAENDGGGGGGFSLKYLAAPYQEFLGMGARTLPDISLNGFDGQAVFFNGALISGDGTSIVAPELAGFFAQENAYLGFLQLPTAGNANYDIYAEAQNAPFYAQHYPFYDITTGCASNDITLNNPLIGYYCAGPGYDLTTGWGSVNMLQLSWAINFSVAGDFAAPQVQFTGPPINTWFNTDQQVSTFFFDDSGSSQPPSGVAGFSVGWDTDPAPESFIEATPGSGDAFYDGPQFPNQDRGGLVLSNAGQGCHTAMAKAWDNTGNSSGLLTYGPVCYDTIAPVSTLTVTGPTSGGVFTSAATVTISATDAGSGVAVSLYSFNGLTYFPYTAPFTLSAAGTYTLCYFSRDNADNTETPRCTTAVVQPTATTVTTVSSSLDPSTSGANVTFTAKVTPSTGATPAGTVTFKDGSATLGTGTLSSGQATFATSALTVGSHVITAVYGGSSTDAGSTSAALTQTVNNGGSSATTTALVSSRNPAPHGKSVTLTATVTPASGGPVSGTVTFKDGAATLIVLNISTRSCAFVTNALTKGTHSITAVYSGNTTLKGSTSAVLKQVVN